MTSLSRIRFVLIARVRSSSFAFVRVSLRFVITSIRNISEPSVLGVSLGIRGYTPYTKKNRLAFITIYSCTLVAKSAYYRYRS
jgi:hypothetical protein